MDDAEERRDWAGQHAMAWVIDDAPVPIELAWTLIVIARRCDKNGCGSYQSMATMAAKTGKSEDQVRRDIKKLLEARLIRLGDQTLPARNSVPFGKRPVVYDVNLDLKGPKIARTSKNPTGRKKQPTPCMDATPGMEAGGGMEATPTPGMDAGSTPCMDATQRMPLNNPLKNPPSPYPLGALEVVDAEILEEGEESTSSLKQKIEDLIDEVMKIRPSWKHDDILIHTNAAFSMLEDSFEAVTEVVLRTARDANSAKPSRITAGGNPHLQAVSSMLMIAKLDQMDVSPIPEHQRADAHPFEPSDHDRNCKRCYLPQQNGRHKVGNQAGGYRAQTSRSPDGRNGPWRPPTDPSEYDKPFSGQVAAE